MFVKMQVTCDMFFKYSSTFVKYKVKYYLYLTSVEKQYSDICEENLSQTSFIVNCLGYVRIILLSYNCE